MDIRISYSSDEVEVLVRADLAAKFPQFRVTSIYDQYGGRQVALTDRAPGAAPEPEAVAEPASEAVA